MTASRASNYEPPKRESEPSSPTNAMKTGGSREAGSSQPVENLIIWYAPTGAPQKSTKRKPNWTNVSKLLIDETLMMRM